MSTPPRLLARRWVMRAPDPTCIATLRAEGQSGATPLTPLLASVAGESRDRYPRESRSLPIALSPNRITFAVALSRYAPGD